MQIVARYVVEIERRIFAKRKHVAVGIVHHRAHHAFGRKLAHRIAHRTLDYRLYAHVDGRHKVKSAYCGKIITSPALDAFAHKVGFGKDLSVYAREIFVVIGFQSRLSVAVGRAKTEKLSHKIAVRIVAQIVFGIIYAVITRCVYPVELLFGCARCNRHFAHLF